MKIAQRALFLNIIKLRGIGLGRSGIILIIILLNFSGSPLLAQVDTTMNGRILVKGKLLAQDSLQAVQFAHLINKSRYWGAISDTAGNFTLAMYPTDTLLITAIGFAQKKYTLPPYTTVSPFQPG